VGNAAELDLGECRSFRDPVAGPGSCALAVIGTPVSATVGVAAGGAAPGSTLLPMLAEATEATEAGRGVENGMCAGVLFSVVGSIGGEALDGSDALELGEMRETGLVAVAPAATAGIGAGAGTGLAVGAVSFSCTVGNVEADMDGCDETGADVGTGTGIGGDALPSWKGLEEPMGAASACGCSVLILDSSVA
jgi:hypothetical protein